MNKIKNQTVIVLGIITIAELLVSGGIGGSILLWCLYGIYKIST